MSWGHPELIPPGTFRGRQIRTLPWSQFGTFPGRPIETSPGCWNRIFRGRSGGFFINISIFSLQILVIYVCYIMWIKRVASGIFLCILFTFVLSMLDFVFFATSLLLTLLHIFKSIGTFINLSTSKSAKIS